MHDGKPAYRGGAWGVAIGGFIALTMCTAPLVIYTQSIFLGPMTREFGWTHSQYFLPLFLAGLVVAFTNPYIGYLADRYGIRRLLLPSIILFSLSYAALGLLGGSFVAYALLIFLLLVFGNVHGVMLYTKALALWPTRRRGLLLATALAGTAVGGMIVPPIAGYLIEMVGWRGARFGLALMVLLIALPAAWSLVRPPPPADQVVAVAKPEDIGILAKNAVRTPTFWLIALSIGLSGLAVNGILGNIVPLLVDQGFSPRTAALALTAIATAQLAGRFMSGMLLDKVLTPRVGVIWFASAMAGLFVVSSTAATGPMIVGMALLGAGLGAEMELTAYFIRRYFGPRNYGQIFGYVFALYSIGATSGPLMIGAMFDMSGDYRSGLYLAEALLLVSIILLLRLAPYPLDLPGQDVTRVDVEQGLS